MGTSGGAGGVEFDDDSTIFKIVTGSALFHQSFLTKVSPPTLTQEHVVAMARCITATVYNLSSDQLTSFTLSQTQCDRVLAFYTPLALWLEQQVQLGKNHGHGAVCVGFSLPQGAGKTTLVECLQQALRQVSNLKSVVLSIDDFYLPHDDQCLLRLAHPANKYLSGRGVAGTHDVQLLTNTVKALVMAGHATAMDNTSNTSKAEHATDKHVSIPRYDKSLSGGQGDRLPRSQWDAVQGPVELVMLEGWMLGFQPVPQACDDLMAFPGMDEVNTRLASYRACNDLLDAAVLVKVANFDYVFEWREQAEQQRRNAGQGAMSRNEVKEFCSRYMPSYYLYSDSLFTRGVAHVPAARTVRFQLDKNRTVMPPVATAKL